MCRVGSAVIKSCPSYPLLFAHLESLLSYPTIDSHPSIIPRMHVEVVILLRALNHPRLPYNVILIPPVLVPTLLPSVRTMRPLIHTTAALWVWTCRCSTFVNNSTLWNDVSVYNNVTVWAVIMWAVILWVIIPMTQIELNRHTGLNPMWMRCNYLCSYRRTSQHPYNCCH